MAGPSATAHDAPLRRRVAVLWAALALLAAGTVFAPWLLVGAAMWAADGPWTFSNGSLKYWVFVRGSRLERVGLVRPKEPAVRYDIRLGEGTFPGWSMATYTSRASPQDSIDAYAERCTSMQFKITQRTATDTRAVLICEIEPYLDIEVAADRASGEGATDITVKVWGP